MHIVRFRAGDEARHGVIEGSHIVEYAGTPYGTFRKARKKYPLKQSVLLAPVVPSKVIAVGPTTAITPRSGTSPSPPSRSSS
jgi:hypothetical protein